MILRTFSLTRKILIIGVAVALLAAGIYIYRHSHSSSTGTAVPAITKDGTPPTTTSTTPVPGATTGQGGAIDQSGQVPANLPESSHWTTSSSGVITLYQPLSNGLLKSGDTVSGAANLDAVQYRLSDNIRGVVAQGELKVVSGKFSGLLQFNSSGATGRLDIFSFSNDTGAEINEIQIPVKLK